MLKQTIVETRDEIIYNCTHVNGSRKNLATSASGGRVTITYTGLAAEDKPTGIVLDATDRNGVTVSISLISPKKPWEAPVEPEQLNLLAALIQEKKYDDISRLFSISKIEL